MPMSSPLGFSAATERFFFSLSPSPLPDGAEKEEDAFAAAA
jgi:hypothetical protein